MSFYILEKDEQYLFNHITKYLSRTHTEARHIYGGVDSKDPINRIAETWRFPIIDSFCELGEVASRDLDEVTFVYAAQPDRLPTTVSVIGSFANLFTPLPLNPISDTHYFSLTVVVPRGELHHYKYMVDGQVILDPINPQRITLDNGELWSRFFTRGCTHPIVFESWERNLLDRLTDHILPFRSKAAENFLARYFNSMDEQDKKLQYRHNQNLGVVNFMDKLLAREESHHQIDYQICLELIDQVLRMRNPFEEPSKMSQTMFSDLYSQMGSGDVNGWDYDRYNKPKYFLQLLRRHTYTGAFSHPDYGGNAGAAAWAYLSERYRDTDSGDTLFDWRRAIAPPLGTSPTYRG